MTSYPPAADDLGRFIERAALPPGWRVVYEPTVESTNDLAREAARRGWPDRSVFVADFQTRGRGRQGRVWQSRPAASLLMSVLLRRADAPPFTFTMLAAVALCEAVERLLALEPAIKWPNDVLVADKKTAGILAELSDDGRERAVVVGIGTNVNLTNDDFADLPHATSLAIEAGRPVHRGELLVLMLERFDSWLKRPVRELEHGIWAAWHGRLWGRRQRIRLHDGAVEMQAVILGADPDGALVVRLDTGEERRIVAGEILP